MNFKEAMYQLAGGNPVYRESWEMDMRLEPQFAGPNADEKEFPYVAEERGVINNGRFRVEEYSGNTRVDVYEFTEHDKQANDWISC